MLYYLLSPEFQIVNTAGKPCTGYLEVYYHGTRDRYYCASDFNGTLHPFQVPLDSLGGNVVLADDSHAYDVYIYNRYGSLLMSRYNVHPSSGGSMGGVITSSDGSVTVTPTQDGWDLSVDDGKAATFRAAADSLSADGYFSFRKIEGEGDAIYLDNGSIKMDDGWYHFSATVKLTWYGQPVNDASTVRLYSGATYDVIDFDYSYNHSDTVVLDGDIWIGAHSTHYISFGRNFSLGVTGMRQGMVAELVDCDLHSIIGQGVGGNGEKNIHRLLRYYTNESEADAEHPVGDWLHDLDAEDPSDPSGHPMVTADELFAWYDEGQIFELYEVDGSNGQLGWSAVYRMVTWQDQSDWWSQFAPVPGKACRLEFYRMGGYSSINRGMLIAYIRYKDEEYMRLYQIMPGQDVWTMDFQPELTAGSNISISGSTISATDTTYTAGTGLSLTGTEFSADTYVLATQSDLAGKQDVLTAGQNITIDSSNVISATDTTYTAGTGIDITNDEISVDTSVVATQTDLSSKQDTLTAGTGITIQNNVISATAAQQVQSNWNETDTADPSYIQNKPDLSIYAESADLATVAFTGDYTDLTNKPTIPSFDSDQMAAINSGVNSTKVGNYDTHIADTTIHVTSTDKSTWNAKQDALTAGSNITIQSNVISATDTTYSAGTGIDITGTTISADTTVLATQQDLSGKQDELTAGSNIQINGSTISATDTTYTAGTGLSLTGTEFAADTTVLATQTDLASKQDTLTAGSNISISNNVISATDTTYSAGTGIDITGTTISADTSVLATQNDLSSKQDALTAGTNIQINGTTISATDTTYTAGTGIDITGTTISADTSVLATQNDLSSKQDTLTAGSNITISNNTISATDTTYSAGTGIDITGTTISADTSVLATQNDLSSKQDTLTAGSNITISGGVISATDTTYSAGTGLSLNGTTFSNADPLPAHTSSESGKILKVDSNGDLEWGAESGGTVTDVQVNGTSVVSGGVADITVPAAQVNSDWTATSGVAEILHKPTEKTLTAGSNVTITEANDTVTISATDTTYTAGTGVDITSGVISADTSVLATQSDLSSKQDTLTAGSNITISNNVISAASQVQSDWTESDTSSAAYIDNKPDLVDIVAGPGIVVDNPDGNTLRVSTEADAETVLWEGTGTTGTTMNLSETVKNFDRIRIYGHESNRGRGCVNEINTNITYGSDTLQFAISMADAAYAGSAWFVGFYFTYLTYSDTNATSLSVTGGDQFFSFVNSTAIQHNTSRYIIIDKVVGIHRRQGGN